VSWLGRLCKFNVVMLPAPLSYSICGSPLRSMSVLIGPSRESIATKIECEISYELPNGPFKVCGIPVKKAIEFAKKLFDVFSKALEVAEAVEELLAIAAELAALEGLTDIAAGLLAGVSPFVVAPCVLLILFSNFFSLLFLPVKKNQTTNGSPKLPAQRPRCRPQPGREAPQGCLQQNLR
jgi:hypothetical protein